MPDPYRVTRQIERKYSLGERAWAVAVLVHAMDHIARTERESLVILQARTICFDGIQNAIDGRATGYEFRTLRHSRLARQDPQHHPVIEDHDRRCHDCGAINPKPFSRCWEHRPEATHA